MQRLGERVTWFAPKVGVSIAGIKVKEMGYRWASCGKIGTLNFYWKCMMAPPKIIDYIVVHELCHLHHRNHTDAFWNEVDKVMPDYRERKAWLRKHGAGLDVQRLLLQLSAFLALSPGSGFSSSVEDGHGVTHGPEGV